jgi:two-component system CheB/CheR fusion protein
MKPGAPAVTPQRHVTARARSRPGAKGFTVVGLGASAGGLEALEVFFKNLPADSGMAFVVVTHQHPGHTSLLPELLRKCTAMPVVLVSDKLRLKPNCVYVSPPADYLRMRKGQLRLVKPIEPAGLRLPIDYFLRSLAEDQRERAVGIILSGTASDGAMGIKAVKGALGLTMAQEPDTAKFPGMPRSAISTGLVDYALPAGDLPRRLLAYMQGPYVVPSRAGAAEDLALPEPMQRVLVLLRNRTGHDFSGYKPTTIRRRIERRMNVHQAKGPQEYLNVLHGNPHEVDLLFRELLIVVTSFFRDPDFFQSLANTALKQLLSSRPDQATLRVWVPGCATGEEAYSLAILLREGAEQVNKHFTFQIFGTDLDSQAINAARMGVYPDGIAVDVSHERLARFFIREHDHYRVNSDIRDMVVFAAQNVIRDPPFTKLDLISCRNLLIYLNAALQKRVLSLFHYSLKPDGLLFLGPSSSVGELRGHFAVLNKKAKIFQRTGRDLPHDLPAELFSGPHDVPSARTDAVAAAIRPERHLDTVFEKLLLQRFVPASVIVNANGDISFIQGRTGNYLEPSPGQARLNVMEMAREGLRQPLMTALRHAADKDEEFVQTAVRVKTNGDSLLVDVSACPITEPESVRGLFLVTFRPSAPALAHLAKRQKSSPADSQQSPIKDLERELLFTKESLQSTVEELQTANEELKSSNEELQSTNEELQSTNEELETSKEEMQSLNEELQTVNAQLQSKVEAFAQANDDMQNLLNSTAIATVFLDGHLKIRRFTQEACKVFNLISSDIGRPLADLVSHLDYDLLVADATEVLRTLTPREREAPTKDGGWRLVRILPYRTTDNMIDGLVITLVDIARLKRTEQEAERSRAFGESVAATVREPFLVLDQDLRVVSANRAFLLCFRMDADDVQGRRVYELGDGHWNIPRLRQLLEEILPRNGVFKDFELAHHFPAVGPKVMLLNARRLVQHAGQRGLILLAMEEVAPQPAQSPGAQKSVNK